MTKLRPTEVLTVPCRLTFPSLFKKTPVHPTTPDKLAYQATILIPPGTDLTPFKRAIVAAMDAGWGRSIKLEGNGMPLKPNDAKSYSGFEKGGFHIKVKSKFMPQVVDQAKQPVLVTGPLASPEELERAIPIAESRAYPGVWCNFYIEAYAWDNSAGKGVSFNLTAVQLVRDDERLDGRKGADEVFGVIEGAETPARAAAAEPEADDPLADLMG